MPWRGPSPPPCARRSSAAGAGPAGAPSVPGPAPSPAAPPAASTPKGARCGAAARAAPGGAPEAGPRSGPRARGALHAPASFSSGLRARGPARPGVTGSPWKPIALAARFLAQPAAPAGATFWRDAPPIDTPGARSAPAGVARPAAAAAGGARAAAPCVPVAAAMRTGSECEPGRACLAATPDGPRTLPSGPAPCAALALVRSAARAGAAPSGRGSAGRGHACATPLAACAASSPAQDCFDSGAMAGRAGGCARASAAALHAGADRRPARERSRRGTAAPARHPAAAWSSARAGTRIWEPRRSLAAYQIFEHCLTEHRRSLRGEGRHQCLLAQGAARDVHTILYSPAGRCSRCVPGRQGLGKRVNTKL